LLFPQLEGPRWAISRETSGRRKRCLPKRHSGCSPPVPQAVLLPAPQGTSLCLINLFLYVFCLLSAMNFSLIPQPRGFPPGNGMSPLRVISPGERLYGNLQSGRASFFQALYQSSRRMLYALTCWGIPCTLNVLGSTKSKALFRFCCHPLRKRSPTNIDACCIRSSARSPFSPYAPYHGASIRAFRLPVPPFQPFPGAFLSPAVHKQVTFSAILQLADPPPPIIVSGGETTLWMQLLCQQPRAPFVFPFSFGVYAFD